ncbi:hypothetical protein [Commensalibacter communis]|uniref:hypothetical protein n=1 Tax=Commensalibacter communis TaxID=2972786 RepID=UPI00232F6E6B|nr:hypothetical protein [Commensalibacter communis]
MLRQDIAATNYANNIAHMIVTVDNTGMRSNSSYRLFTERSRYAVLNSKCSTLSIPSNMPLGHRNTIQFAFKP